MLRTGFRNAIGFGVFGPTCLTASTGWAQAEAATQPIFWGGSILSGIVLASMVAWLQRRRRHAERRAHSFAASSSRLEAFLDAVPQAYCGWSNSGAAAVSDSFLGLLGLREVAREEDIETALDTSDAAAFHSALARLRTSGEPFTLKVSSADGLRRFSITGRRGRALRDEEHFDVLWLADITDQEAVSADQVRRASQMERRHEEAERVQAELCAMLDALPLPVWLRRGDLKLGWANRAYLHAVDGSLQSVLNEQREIGASVFAEGGRALARRARSDGAAQSEKRHIVVAGERRLLEFTEVPAGSAKPADLTIGYALDLTRLEELQGELGRHIAAHADVLERLKSAIAIFGPDKRLKFFNQSYVLLWNFDEAWLETEPTLAEILEHLHESRQLTEYADFPAFKRSQTALFTSLIEPSEDLMHLPDGKTLRSVVTPHPFGGLLFVMEDVTSALALERNYNTLMAVQRESLDNLAEGIAVYGSDGRLRLSNPAFMRIWNLSPTDVSGQPHVSEVIDKTRPLHFHAEDWTAYRDELITAALERSERTVRMERPDGSVIAAATVSLPDGGVLNSFLDITDSVRVELALRASNAALETADRLKSEFIANVSYQLRTPLNAIMGFAEILNNKYFGELNARQAEYAENIIDASQRLLQLINDILDLATIEAGYMALERRPVDIHPMLKSVYDIAREWAGKQSLQLSIVCDRRIGFIEADERRLKQALYNLVSNAIKFTPPGGRITLAAQREADTVILTVTDTGIGIPEADQRRVFGRFEKAHPNARHSGVGLGLALVKSFIEMHGGRLELKSKPGDGTTISCILPSPPALMAQQRPARVGRGVTRA